MTKQLPKTCAEKYFDSLHERWPGIDFAEVDAKEKLRASKPGEDITEQEYFYTAAVGAMVKSGTPVSTINEMLADPASFNDLLNPEDIDMDLRWKQSKHVFRFDETLSEELGAQGMPGKIPTEIIKMMPYPLMFIEADVDEATTIGTIWKTKGFFCYLETWRGKDRLVLQYLLKDGNISMVALNLECKETIGDFVDELKNNLASRIESGDTEWEDDAVEVIEKSLAHAMNLIVYINAENADTEVIYKASGESKKHKTSKATIHAVGTHVGPRLGAARAAYISNSEEHSTGSKKSPHVRRGHFHTYLPSPKSEKRIPVVRWQNPMLIGFGVSEDVTVHEVIEI